MDDHEDHITGDDLAQLNRRALERSAELARRVGEVVIGIGLLGVAAFAWTAFRTQQGGGLFSGFTLDGAELPLRIDLVVSQFSQLLLGVAVLALGLTLRLLADYTAARAGVAISGVAVGDPLPEPLEDTGGDGWAP